MFANQANKLVYCDKNRQNSKVQQAIYGVVHKNISTFFCFCFVDCSPHIPCGRTFPPFYTESSIDYWLSDDSDEVVNHSLPYTEGVDYFTFCVIIQYTRVVVGIEFPILLWQM
jgi:hypothetical protein